MKNEEVNKVIAEYYYDEVYRITDDTMFVGIKGHDAQVTPYTNSLDALVPVWERLREYGIWINKMGNRNYNHFEFFSEKDISEYSPFDPFDFYESLHTDTIQEAAAHATAKAILSLEEK